MNARALKGTKLSSDSFYVEHTNCSFVIGILQTSQYFLTMHEFTSMKARASISSQGVSYFQGLSKFVSMELFRQLKLTDCTISTPSPH